MSKYLIFNAHSAIGGKVYRKLVEQDCDVFCLQDDPPLDFTSEDAGRWLRTKGTELSYYSEVLAQFEKLVHAGVIFDTIIFGEAFNHSAKEIVEFPFTLYRDSWQLLIGKVGRKFKVLRQDGHVVHLLPTTGNIPSTWRVLTQLILVGLDVYRITDHTVTLEYPAVPGQIDSFVSKLITESLFLTQRWDLTGGSYG